MSEELTPYRCRGNVHGESGVRKRMRKPVESVYKRQVAKCLSDIEEIFELPAIVQDRIKLAIEYTCKDVDKLRLKSNPNGGSNDQEEYYNKHFGNR